MAGEDLPGAIDLLQEHDAGKQMRPGHRSERKDRPGTVEDGAVETVGAADRKGEFGKAAVAPLRDPFGESAARPREAALVEGDEAGIGRQGRQDQLGFARLQGRLWQPPARFQFDDRDGRCDAPGVERLQFFQRPTARSADRDEAKAQRGRVSSARRDHTPAASTPGISPDGSPGISPDGSPGISPDGSPGISPGSSPLHSFSRL